MPRRIMGNDQKKRKSLNLPNHRERIKSDQEQKPRKKKTIFFASEGKLEHPFRKMKQKIKEKAEN